MKLDRIRGQSLFGCLIERWMTVPSLFYLYHTFCDMGTLLCLYPGMEEKVHVYIHDIYI